MLAYAITRPSVFSEDGFKVEMPFGVQPGNRSCLAEINSFVPATQSRMNTSS